MAIHNREITDQFSRLADLLEIQDANPFRVRAYRNAARTVGSLPREVAEMLGDDEDLSELPGIGEDLAGKIAEIVKHGKLPLLEEVGQEIDPQLSNLMELSTIGPKRVQKLHEELAVESLPDLKRAAEEGQVRTVEGFGEKTEEKILREIERRDGEEQRTKRSDVVPIATALESYLADGDGVKVVVVAGNMELAEEADDAEDTAATLLATVKGAQLRLAAVAYIVVG